MSAREAAAKFGVHPRTIRSIVAEPREDFLARAKARRDHAVELRSQGMKQREIAEAMGVPLGTVGRLLWEAKKLAEAQESLQERESA